MLRTFTQGISTLVAGSFFVGLIMVAPPARADNELTINEIGDLGVGTDMPSTALHIVRTLVNPAVQMERGSNSWVFTVAGSGFRISKTDTGGREMQIANDGTVTMGPAGAVVFTLHPNGDLDIDGSLMTGTTVYPDYVFETDYPLMPLAELATFIKDNQHLPNIPTAAQVKQQNMKVNMSVLQMQLLEKVEELTLYTLEQENQLTKKDSRLSKLEKQNVELLSRLADIEERLNK